MPTVISANHLADGLVVYFTAPGSWTREMAQAKTFSSDDEAEAGLALAKDDVKKSLIVDPFAVDVTANDGEAVAAVSLRNAIRAKGPTIDFMPRVAS